MKVEQLKNLKALLKKFDVHLRENGFAPCQTVLSSIALVEDEILTQGILAQQTKDAENAILNSAPWDDLPF